MAARTWAHRELKDDHINYNAMSEAEEKLDEIAKLILELLEKDPQDEQLYFAE